MEPSAGPAFHGVPEKGLFGMKPHVGPQFSSSPGKTRVHSGPQANQCLGNRPDWARPGRPQAPPGLLNRSCPPGARGTMHRNGAGRGSREWYPREARKIEPRSLFLCYPELVRVSVRPEVVEGRLQTRRALRQAQCERFCSPGCAPMNAVATIPEVRGKLTKGAAWPRSSVQTTLDRS